MNIVLFADQLWRTKLAIEICKMLQVEINKSMATIVLTDYYTFQHARSEMQNLISTHPNIEFLTLESYYLKWQSDHPKHVESKIIDFEQWEEKNCKNRNFKDLLATDYYLNNFERAQFSLKTPSCCKNFIYSDIISWIESIFSTKVPDFVLFICNESFASNIAFELCENRKVNNLTLIPSRIGNAWLLSRTFGIGTDNVFQREVGNYSMTNDDHLFIKKFENDLISNGLGSYITWSNGAYVESSNSTTSSHALDTIPSFFKETKKFFINIVNFAKQTYSNIFLDYRNLKYRPQILAENPYKVTYFQFRALIINTIRSLGFKFWGTDKIPNRDYYLWALHNRPEGSTLVLGQGIDEIELLNRVAERIPGDTVLAVKENPLMFGYRARRFYSNLKKNKKIILIDSWSTNSPLIANSRGTIGLSGTILLESLAFRKPSLAFGLPEFSSILPYKGWKDLDEFFNFSLSGKNLSKRQVDYFKSYVCFIKNNSENNGIKQFSSLETFEAKKFISWVASKIAEYLNLID